MARSSKLQKKQSLSNTGDRVQTRSSAAMQSPRSDQQRQPQKCTKCPGRPLRSQCAHTRKGKEYIAQHAAELALSNPLPSTSNHSPSLSDPFTSISASEHHCPRDTSTSTPSTPATPSPRPVTVLTSHDLAHLSLRSTGSSMSSSQSGSSASARVAPNRTSARNPYNGYVDGAYRGTEVYQIVCGHRLPSPISDNTRAVKKFTNAINSIIEKCEDISRETACWLFIGAQHSTARGGAISYASPRLWRDAAAQVGNIGTQFSSLTRNLINARTQENVELQRQLDESRRQNEEISLQLQAVNQSQKELDRELRRYKSRYNLDS
ncbi:hypothetical protein JR316_0007405 [Psilocybe cubensis]|uniref:Uncharacterized protein n=2 Tax=Psilocybe cubensis TaxID=181762 RepID=A0ACB8GYI6_PSICU|nr:hypothetical protein JR316_0007405 [Psilocybe cubensis]KAH9480805.1 hypothetical protein JR316_0007405 [Psilocybe cubensis]